MRLQWQKFLREAKPTSEELSGFSQEVLKTNLVRLNYLAYLGALVTLFHVIIFRLGMETADPIQYSWREGIVFSHLTLFFYFILLAIAIAVHRRKRGSASRITGVLPHATFIVLIIMGSWITGFDQIITDAITPFLVVTLLTAIFILTRPWYVTIYLLTGLAFLIFFLYRYQENPDIALSNIFNGLTITAIGWALSHIFWRNFLLRFRSDRVIASQQEEMRQQNIRLQKVASELKQANNTKLRLFLVISHDLRGPLANLNQLIQLVQNEDLSEETFRELLIELGSQSYSNSDLLENLLNYAKNSLKGNNITPEEINIRNLADGIAELYDLQARNKKLKIANRIDPSLRVKGDKAMISLIIRNLISNALKFSPAGGLITLESRSGGAMCRVTVTDEGVGIPEARLPLIFNDLTYSTPGTEGEKGSGLGLMLIKEFALMNGGETGVESQPGKGSSFWFTIPLSQSE